MNTLTLLMLCLMPALQDPGWTDTHRVHLRNGNFLDGVLVQFGEKDVLFRWSPGVLLRIKVADIKGNIEEIKIRTLHSKPKEVQVRVETPSTGTDPVADVKPPVRDPNKAGSDIDKFFTKILATPEMTYETLAKEVKGLGLEGAKAMIAEVQQMDSQRTDLVFVSLDQMRDLPIDAEIRGLLDAKRSDIRAAAVNLLANRTSGDSLRAVLRLIKDPAPAVRTAVLMALPNFNEPSTLEPIAELAIDPDPQVRARAIRSAEELSGRTEQDNTLVQRWTSLIGRGPMEAIGELASGIARLADRANEEFPTEEVRHRLGQMLSFREPQARAAGAYALTSVKPPEQSADQIQSALEGEREPKVIVTMCDALGKLRLQKSADVLVEKIRDTNKDVQTAAQRALEKISGNTENGVDYDKWREWLDKSKGQNP